MVSGPARSSRFPPRVELHLHLEGSVTLRRIRTFWDRPRRDPALPSHPSALYRHRSFAEFLRHFAQVTRVLRRPEDLACVTSDLCRHLKRQGVVAAEVFFTPVIFMRRGIPFLEMLDAMDETVAQERGRGGPAIGWILDGVRQWGAAGLETHLECARQAPGRILGIGMGGDERSIPASEFAELFAEARRMGLRTVAHAGEFEGPRSVWEAVEVLGAERIGHGIRASEDRVLLGFLRRRRIPLEVCPTSNIRTKVVRHWRDHPLPVLVKAGLRVTVNSDDPALFRTSLSSELRLLDTRFKISRRGIRKIEEEAVRASFLPARDKKELLMGRRGAVLRALRRTGVGLPAKGTR
ncbi:MAG TPA: adenosine deaminase [Candidatus Polarisedimenticolia bacterium]|nr:adenosine deaminase [Candidatus Polarisedimenticolia bacterium]